jgi:hypothetical protein
LWWMSRMTSAVRISRFPNLGPDIRTNLPPFAVQPAFPTSDYYGGSVAMRLSPFRPSRGPYAVDVTGWFRCPFRVLETATGSPVETLECVYRCLPCAAMSGPHRVTTVLPDPFPCGLDTRVEAIQLSPCHPGLDGLTA